MPIGRLVVIGGPVRPPRKYRMAPVPGGFSAPMGGFTNSLFCIHLYSFQCSERVKVPPWLREITNSLFHGHLYSHLVQGAESEGVIRRVGVTMWRKVLWRPGLQQYPLVRYFVFCSAMAQTPFRNFPNRELVKPLVTTKLKKSP